MGNFLWCELGSMLLCLRMGIPTLSPPSTLAETHNYNVNGIANCMTREGCTLLFCGGKTWHSKGKLFNTLIIARPFKH